MKTIILNIEEKNNETRLIGKHSNFIFYPNTINGEELSDFLAGCEEIPDPTAQLQEEIETLVECDIPTVMSNYGKADGTRESSINYNEGHQTSWKKGFKKALEITNPSITQLQSDNAELLEALEKVKRLEPIICMGGAVAEQWQNEAQALNEMMAEIESLIQKHKQ